MCICVNVYVHMCPDAATGSFSLPFKKTTLHFHSQTQEYVTDQTCCSLSAVTLNNTGASFKYRVVSVRTSVRRMRECMCVCVRAPVRMRACMRVCARVCVWCVCVCVWCGVVCGVVWCGVCVCVVSRVSAGHLRKRSTDSVSWTYIYIYNI